MKKYLLLAIVSVLMSSSALADDFQLPTLSKSDLEKSSKELLSNFTHTSVSPPGSLGKIFGIEAGVVGGLTSADEIGALVNEVDSSTDIDQIPHAGILGRVSIPYNVTFEGLIIPDIEAENAELSHLSLAAQWDYAGLPLVDLGIKAHFGTSEFAFSQKIGSDANGEVEYDNSTYGLLAMAGADFMVLNPYVGLGVVKGDSTLEFTASGSNSLFSFTNSNSADVDETSAQYLAGLQVDLFLIHLAAEYSHQFDTDRISAKFSFAF